MVPGARCASSRRFPAAAACTTGGAAFRIQQPNAGTNGEGEAGGGGGGGVEVLDEGGGWSKEGTAVWSQTAVAVAVTL